MTGKRRITSLDEFAASDRPLKRTADSEPSSSVPFSQAAGARDATVQQLSRLLDLTPLVDYGEIQNRFDEIAELLLRGFHLQVTRSSPDATAWTADYEILELEFYLWKARCHEDPFTHGSDEQRRSGRWYFHRPPSRSNTAVSYDTASNHKRGMSTTGGGYRGGTRKGLDLTFGCPVQAEIGTTSRYFSAVTIADTRRSENLTSVQDEVRGGILLRTLRRLSDGKIISGPSLLVDEILRASNASTIASLVADKWGDDTLAWSAVAHSQTRISSLELTPIPTSDTPKREKPQMYTSPRIGLDLSHSSIPSPTVDMQKALGHPRITFVSRPYRYFIHPELLTSNGRGHTFLGAYNFVVKSSEKKLSEQILKESVINSTGLKMSSVRKYMEEYAAGVLCGKEGRIAAFIGSKGKGAGSSPTTALRMFGALDGVTGVPECKCGMTAKATLVEYSVACATLRDVSTDPGHEAGRKVEGHAEMARACFDLVSPLEPYPHDKADEEAFASWARSFQVNTSSFSDVFLRMLSEFLTPGDRTLNHPRLRRISFLDLGQRSSTATAGLQTSLTNSANTGGSQATAVDRGDGEALAPVASPSSVDANPSDVAHAAA